MSTFGCFANHLSQECARLHYPRNVTQTFGSCLCKSSKDSKRLETENFKKAIQCDTHNFSFRCPLICIITRYFIIFHNTFINSSSIRLNNFFVAFSVFHDLLSHVRVCKYYNMQ